MGLLLWIGRQFSDKLKNGDLILIYCIMYPVTRFTLEFLRLDSSQVAGVNINQTVMAVVAVLAIVGLDFTTHIKEIEKVVDLKKAKRNNNLVK